MIDFEFSDNHDKFILYNPNWCCSCIAGSSVSTQTEGDDEESSKHLQLPKPVKRSNSTVSFNLPQETAENTSSRRRSMLHNFRGSMLSIASARSIIGTTRDILSQWFVLLGILLFVIVVVIYNLWHKSTH